MYHIYLFFCSLLLISIWQHSCNAIPFMNSLHMLKKATPLLKFIQRRATRGERFKSFISKPKHNSPTKLEQLDKLSAEISLLKHEFLSALSNRILDKFVEKTDRLFSHINTVEHSYKIFLDIAKNNNEANPQEVKDFIKNATTYRKNGLRATIVKIHEALVDLDVKGESILTLIAKESRTRGMVCKQGKSPQIIIQDLYRHVALAHMKGLFIMTYTYGLKEELKNSYAFRRRSEMQDFINAVQRTGEKVKQVLKSCSQDLYICSFKEGEHREGITYWKLNPIFQAYLVYEGDIYQRTSRSVILTSCSSYKHEVLSCKSSICRAQKQEKLCTSYLRDCMHIDSSMQVCHSTLSSQRRYEWMMTNSGTQYGHKNNTHCENTQDLKGNYFDFVSICLCNCEDSYQDIARYFSLRPATSNFDKNYVIISAQLVLKNFVVYIKIAQAKLKGNGSLNNDVEYKVSSEVSTDTLFTKEIARHHPSFFKFPGYLGWTAFYKNDNVYAVTYSQKTVFLDDLKAPPNHVVIGMRFQQVDNNLRFEILTAPFDYASGQLNVKERKWNFENNDLKRRTELDLGDPDDPARSTIVDAISNNNQYVRFRMSGLKEDLGQNTVPFIDAQEVIPSTLLPITGAGLVHKGTKGSGGFLTLKLQHYDLSNYYD